MVCKGIYYIIKLIEITKLFLQYYNIYIVLDDAKVKHLADIQSNIYLLVVLIVNDSLNTS